jgi:exonuclease VII large subunit
METEIEGLQEKLDSMERTRACTEKYTVVPVDFDAELQTPDEYVAVVEKRIQNLQDELTRYEAEQDMIEEDTMRKLVEVHEIEDDQNALRRQRDELLNAWERLEAKKLQEESAMDGAKACVTLHEELGKYLSQWRAIAPRDKTSKEFLEFYAFMHNLCGVFPEQPPPTQVSRHGNSDKRSKVTRTSPN